MAAPVEIAPGHLVNPSQYSKDDVWIGVMGVTGAGKTTFISKCCREADAGIGHGLKSETKAVGLYTTTFGGRRIHLIDTPGFDDTYRSDSDVLRDLAYWLAASYGNGFRLTGIIYLHPITATRLAGAAFKNLRAFQKLCGKQAMSSIVLATTMWADISLETGERRETELKLTEEFWGGMIREGSMPFRYTGDHHSAMNIISHLLNKKTVTVLKLQTEMAVDKKDLDETDAGREVDGEMIKQREKFEARLEASVKEMEAAVQAKDEQWIEEAAKAQSENEAKLKEIQRGREELKTSMEKLIREKEEEHKKAMAELNQQLSANKLETQKSRQELLDLKEAAATREREAERRHALLEEEISLANQRAEQSDADSMQILTGAVMAMKEQKDLADLELQKLRADQARLEEQLRWKDERPPQYSPPAYSAPFPPPPQQYPAYQQPAQSSSADTVAASILGVGMAGVAMAGVGCQLM